MKKIYKSFNELFGELYRLGHRYPKNEIPNDWIRRNTQLIKNKGGVNDAYKTGTRK